MKNFKKLLSLLFMALAITACGGGGGGGGDGGTTPPPAGSSDWDTMVWDQDNWS